MTRKLVFAVLLLMVVASVAQAMEPVAPGAGAGVIEAGRALVAAAKAAFEYFADNYHGIDLLWWARV